MLEVINLRKEFTGTIAVDDISFSVSPGSIFGLLGPNGAGKTTTIRTILDIIKPTSGEIRFDGQPLSSEFQNNTGYLPEERGLYKKSKVIDIIKYLAELKGLSPHKAATLAVEWLKRLEIENYKEKKLEELSKGNQQKVQFITALVHDPSILILDEPFSGFDPINQQLIKDLILSLVNSGKIIILSTHQMELAEKLCSDILLINQGKEVCSGKVNDVRKRFGTNSVKIEFSGDGSFLKSLPYVQNLDAYNNYAEIELKQDIEPSQFLHDVSSKIQLRHFSVIEPTLNRIFIDVIKKTSV
ncbi:MAG TPA: ATP-binding cassette domain-containing protein [Ignavibacteriaceae bacterium]|jgi:ABC-2 type transport system ATP-binding protein|nr:ATP-binding cassette domain-containing protein [Ignavibacteriaceae bacterium]